MLLQLQMHLFIIFIGLCCIYSLKSASIAPSWIRDTKIDAGQVKAVNYASGIQIVAGANYTFNQPFVNGTFTRVPRFIYAMNSYGIKPTAQYNTTSMGYQLTITNLLTTYYVLSTRVWGVTMIALNYQYIAIQSYDHLYHISMDDAKFTTTFDSASPMVNTALGATRSVVLQFINPDQFSLNQNYSSSTDLILRVWPVSFTHTPSGNVISFKLVPAIVSRTSFSVTITVDNQFILEKLRISVLYVNTTQLYENAYSQYVVISSAIYYGGNSSLTNTTASTYTTATQGTHPFIFRNIIYGYRGFYIPLLPTVANMFYFNAIVTNPLSIVYMESVQQSMRSCSNSSFLIFRVEDGLCHDSCPTTGYYIFNGFCNKCHSSCVNCTSNTATSCTACNTINLRVLTNGSCTCITYYVDLNNICTQCHYTCLSCSSQLQSGCKSCQSSLNRELINNSTCSCLSGYYQNVICILCLNSCTTCNYYTINSTYQCLSCLANSSRVIVSSACVCDNGYFEQNNTCHSCSTGCLNCNSSTVCLQCNVSAFYVLNGSVCNCRDNFTPNGTVCQSNGIIECGNSVLQTGQACDDGNLFNLDGCSQTCTVESDHTCINNNTLSFASVCFYSKEIIFQVLSIFKQPLENTVQIVMQVSALNCNQTYLEIYLQNNPSLELQDTSRLLNTLNSPDITSAQASYNTENDELTINFEYSKTIDLSKKLIIFSPSSSISLDPTKYFYNSPSISTQLITPTNKLPTIFFTQTQIVVFKTMKNIYLALIVLWWAFMLVAFYFNQTAIMVESFLIIQIVYESLIKCEFIFQGWTGLILYGKYTYGYNIPYKTQRTYDKFQILSLNSNLFSTLNLTFVLLITSILVILVIVIYQTIKFKMEQAQNRNQQITKPEDQGNFNQKLMSVKHVITVLLFEIGLAFSFLTVKITTMSLVQTKGNSSITLSFAIVLYSFYALIWFIYFKYYKMELFMNVSFKKILRQPNQSSEMPMSGKLIQFFTKYYYFIMFILLIVFGIVITLNINGIAFFITIIMASIFFIALGLASNVYYRRQNSIRAFINILLLSVLMILNSLQSRNFSSFIQSNVEPILGISILFLTFTFNIGIILRIQYKKYRNRSRINNRKKQRINKIKVSEQIRNQTQQPHIQKIAIFQNIEYNEHMHQEDLNKSQEQLNKSNKFSANEERSEISLPETNKKIATKYEQNYEKTKQKFENIDISELIRYQEEQKSNQRQQYQKTVEKIIYRKEYKVQQMKRNQQQQGFQEIQVIALSKSHSIASKNHNKESYNNQIKQQQQAQVPPKTHQIEVSSFYQEETKMEHK